jgi:hypothetical protein
MAVVIVLVDQLHTKYLLILEPMGTVDCTHLKCKHALQKQAVLVVSSILVKKAISQQCLTI